MFLMALIATADSYAQELNYGHIKLMNDMQTFAN